MPKPRTKVKVVDGDVKPTTRKSRVSSSSSSSCEFALKTSCFDPPDDLISELAELGFDGAAAFVVRYEGERIRRAIARAKGHPPGRIKNIPGYIRFLVKTPGPIPGPEKARDDVDKYTSGKYGHMVKT